MLVMKRILILLAFLVLLSACTSQQPSAPVPASISPPASSPPAENTCATNNDCVRTGCSGIICQSNKQEPVFTTCEFRPEDACYNEVPCGCFQGSCQWSNEAPYTGVLDKCLAEKQGKPAEGVVDEQGVPIV